MATGGGKSVELNDGTVNVNIKQYDTQFDLVRDEVLASSHMKALTHKYGTKGKSPKYIFLQAFQDGQKADAKGLFANIPSPRHLTCNPVESTAHGFMDEFETEGEEGSLAPPAPTKVDPALAQLLSRPAAMVTQSNFIRRLEDQVKMEVVRAGCPSPHFGMDWIDEEIRGPKLGANGTEGTYETYTIPDQSDEPEEKMVARLKIYRRAFSALILHFEALRPILKDIKRNYDGMLTFREKQVGEATKVKKNIHHLELSLDQRMVNVRFEGFKKLAELDKQCFLLMRHVDKQDMAMRTMTDILNKLEASLSEEHDLRRDSEDQRKLLIVEINELRRKLGMTPRTLEISTAIQIDEDDEEQEIDIITTEDPIILRRALEITRTNLSEAHHRLTILEAAYSDVIPRFEFEELKVVMSSLEAEHSKMIETYEAVNSKTEGLRTDIEKLTGERNTLAELVGDLRKRATPRPSWEKFGEHIEGGPMKWKSIIQGRSTADIIPTLIQELTGKKLLGPPEFIQPLGKGSDVPQLLRHESQVRRRNFSRRDVLVVLQDIWQARAEKLDLLRRYNEAKEEEANGSYGSSPLGDVPEEMPLIGSFMDFVSEYFRTRFPLPNMRMEWIYNILETCRKLGGIEPKLSQFLDIFEGRRDEGVYHLFRAQVGKLRNAVMTKSEETGQAAGSILFKDFGKLLRDTFGEKTEEEIGRLLGAASAQTGIHAEFSSMKYIAFFAMTDEGLAGTFVEEFAKQFEENRLKYVYEILAEVLGDIGVSLSSAERDNDPAGETDVTMLQVFSAFITTDPTLPDDKLGSALTWIFLGISTLPGASPRGIRLADFLRNSVRLSEFHEGDQDGDEESDDFERAITELLTEKEVEDLNEMGRKQRKRWVDKKRITNLGTVVRRLKGGPFLRHGPRFPVALTGTEGSSQEVNQQEVKGAQETQQSKAPTSPNPQNKKTVKESTRKSSDGGGKGQEGAETPPTGATQPKKDKKKKKGK